MTSSTTTTTPKKTFTIAVAGAGIGGVALTVGLLKQGIPVHLYESAPAFAEIGAGVSFGPNSLHAMTLIDPAVRAAYDKRATSNGWPEKKRTWFDFRYGMTGEKMGQHIAEVVAGETGQNSVHRAHFLDELVALLPEGCTSFGKRVMEVEEVGEGDRDGGGVRIKFQDGTTAEASALIGCDGVKSRVRQIVLGESDPAAHAVFTGKYAYRGLIPMEKAVGLLGNELARNSQMYLGYHGHVLTFPIEKGKTMNVVAFQSKSDGKWEDERWVLPMQKEDMFRDFEGWGESVRDVLSLMEKPDVWALFDLPPARTYYKGRICLLGDSAHASTPHQGAGAGMALEDAFVLSNLLGSVHKAVDIGSAFRAYDAVRRPRTQKLSVTSRTAGQLYEFEGEGIGDDEEKIREDLGRRYRWIWEGDLERNLSEAKAILGERAKLA